LINIYKYIYKYYNISRGTKEEDRQTRGAKEVGATGKVEKRERRRILEISTPPSPSLPKTRDRS